MKLLSLLLNAPAYCNFTPSFEFHMFYFAIIREGSISIAKRKTRKSNFSLLQANVK